MTWTRLSDDFCDRDEIASLTDPAFRAHVEALVYCNRMLYDGRLPKSVVGRVLTRASPKVYAELVKAGLWVEEPEHFTVDWGDQESAEAVGRRREDDAFRQKRRRLHGKGDHSLCDPERCWVLRGVTPDVTGESHPESTRESHPDVTA